MNLKFSFFFLFFFLIIGCGYSTQGQRYNQERIRIKPAANKIKVAYEARRYSDYTTYPALIEDKLTRSLINEFNTRSNLDVVSKAKDALILECQIIDYRRRTLRYTSSDDPKEQRLRLYVQMKLFDSEGEVIQEREIIGQTTFYLTDSEITAQKELVKDTARRVREAVVQAW